MRVLFRITCFSLSVGHPDSAPWTSFSTAWAVRKYGPCTRECVCDIVTSTEPITQFDHYIYDRHILLQWFKFPFKIKNINKHQYHAKYCFFFQPSMKIYFWAIFLYIHLINSMRQRVSSSFFFLIRCVCLCFVSDRQLQTESGKQRERKGRWLTDSYIWEHEATLLMTDACIVSKPYFMK